MYNETRMYIESIHSPCGVVEVIASEKGITAIRFTESDDIAETPSALTSQACAQLQEYFAGKRTTFDLPLAAAGTTFQQQVWQALLNIPYGKTCSYGDIARAIGNPKGVRAVGLANGKNPLAIVVPCHRVIGANGKLTGYAGGLNRKQQLLALEGAL